MVDGAMKSCGTAVGDHGVAHRRRAGEHVIGRGAARLALDAEPGRGVALRIEIDDQHVLADGRQGGAEIDRGRGLADAALLVGDRQHPRAAGLGPGGRLAEGDDLRVGGGVGRAACRSWRHVQSFARGLEPGSRLVRAELLALHEPEATIDDAALRAGLAGHLRGLNSPIFSGFGQFSIYILSLGEQADRAALRSKETPDRTGFSMGLAPAPSPHPPFPRSFPQISPPAPGALAPARR